jgi:putative oxidoreductase
MTRILWPTYIAAAALLFLAGMSKLASIADTIVLYEAIGMGQWFRYVAGSIEVTTAVSLLVPSLTSVAGIGMSLTVVEAGLTYLALIGHGVSVVS